MKRILSLILCLSLLLVCAGCGSKQEDDTSSSEKASDTQVFRLKAAESVSDFEDEGKVIICWGDSITQGMAMETGYTYPQQLQGNIGSAYKVINAGVPGENSDAILSRANAVEIYLTYDVIFDKGEAQVPLDRYLFTLPDELQPITYKGFGNQLKLSNVIIGDEHYTIEFESGESYDNGIYKLTRTDTSSALTLKAGAKVQFDYSSQYTDNYCNVILMGANDGDQTAEKLLAKYKKLVALNENYIAIVPFYADDYTKEFKEAFGDKALCLREYFMTEAAKDYDVELTELDGYCIRKGMIPGSFNYKNERGDCHLNEMGYKILADQVYKKGVELGYWK